MTLRPLLSRHGQLLAFVPDVTEISDRALVPSHPGREADGGRRLQAPAVRPLNAAPAPPPAGYPGFGGQF